MKHELHHTPRFPAFASFVQPLVTTLPKLKVVMEHITTSEAVAFVTAAPANVAATITPQHLLYNRNAIFQVQYVESNLVLGMCVMCMCLMYERKA